MSVKNFKLKFDQNWPKPLAFPKVQDTTSANQEFVIVCHSHITQNYS